MEFVRYGGLSLVNQKGYKSENKEQGFHSPPARKGIYAFVRGLEEPFLLGSGKPGEGKGYGQIIRDINGNKWIDHYVHETHEYVQKYIDDKRYLKDMLNICKYYGTTCKIFENGDYMYVHYKANKPKIFEYNGEIWHHLGKYCKNKDIITRHCEWVKTDIEAFRKALNRELLHNNLEMFKGKHYRLPYRPNGYYSLDHLEVFIDRKI